MEGPAETIVSRPHLTALRRFARWLRGPKQLGRRIQWLFLIMGLFNVVGSLPRTFTSPESSPGDRIAVCVAVAFLAVWWIRGYRANRMSAWALPIEAAAIAAIGNGQFDYVASLGMLFSVISYRGQFGSWRQVLGFVAAGYAGSIAAVLHTQPEHLQQFLVQSAGVPRYLFDHPQPGDLGRPVRYGSCPLSYA